MKRKIFLIIIVIMFLSGCYIMVYQTWIEKPKFELANGETEEKSDLKKITYISPGKGRHAPEEGPWNDRLLIAISDDGIKWKKLYRIISDQASVPDVIVDEEGNIRVYYVDFYNKGITLAISKDLENWKYIKVEGIEHSWEDPSVVNLPSGSITTEGSSHESSIWKHHN